MEFTSKYINSVSNGYINRGIYNVINQIDNNGYRFMEVENYWIATKDGWTNYYPKKIKICEEVLDEIENTSPKLIFTCEKSGKYIIYLKQGNGLYIK